MALGSISLGYLLFSLLHFGQFVLAITVCALYGIDLDRARKAGVAADGKWVYAEVVGGLAALTSILYCIPYILRFALVWAWNLVLFILWIALFGLFGKMYIHEDPEGNGDIQRMKNAVWVVLASALLWLIGVLAHFIYWWGHRERRSRFTSRARV
ncbi:hypothetical protein B0J18DRAFT_462991 [Chaetomium sp. MPI-SDFR-AT-0129]|uniref:Uncharacterized protein n=1 Tax=Dichotomopilus funicola TaxID=1934379 RepID=A0AAN6ZMW4_9PEZI|nr:hypothetical protein B0J18DRAFT_462991 [Chaetomium sp. MPI-SDFR-AT-0129]KAK4143529.1 hypothetical protein C8A04DRAFT_37329 [Dichotomopilus funicola]